MRFARWVLLISGTYGLLVLVPFYFLEQKINTDAPPAITHPEYYYGFVGVGVAWQVAFLIIGFAPLRHRPLMIPAILEKVTFGFAAIVLFLNDRIPLAVFVSGCSDLVWAVLFAVAFFVTRPSSGSFSDRQIAEV
jgi:hypothetical protein